jgi:hypothetical protein
MVEAYLELLELAFYEVTFAFDGLADEKVWKRPAAGLLSVGELAGHIAYWEALRLSGERVGTEPDPVKIRVSSPLIDPRFKYYPVTKANPPSEEQLGMTADQVCRELVRVHEESIAHFKALNPDPESLAPGLPAHFTYREYLKYLVFHVSYHTGQMYSVRHLLGDEPPDN